MATIHGERNPAPPKKKKPTPVPKPSAGARSFGAHTAIFVPPELQHEHRGKPAPLPPRSVVSTTPPTRPESLTEKRARLARETHARERLRIGKHITSATGENDTSAVPDYHPPPKGLLGTRSIHGLHVWDPIPLLHASERAGKLALTAASLPAHLLIPNPGRLDPRHGGGPTKASELPIAKAAVGIGKAGAEMLDPFAKFLTPNPGRLARPDRAPAKYSPTDLKKQIEAMSDQLIGKSLTNLVAEADTPNSGMQAAGVGVGILGILPFGQVTKFARFGKALKAAGKAGDALEMTPAREATYKALAQRYGVEKADAIIVTTDNIARQDAAAKGIHNITEAEDWYAATPIEATSFRDFTPEGDVHYQTGAGTRHGLVEGRPGKPVDPIWDELNPKAAFKATNKGGMIHFVSNPDRMLYTAEKTGPDSFRLTNTDTDEEFTMTMNEARRFITQGDTHHTLTPSGAAAPSTEVPVFKPELPAKAESLPTKQVGGVEVFTHAKEQLASTLENAVKPGEWSESGMEAFFDSYPAGAAIPKKDLTTHLASSLNAYDVDEVIHRSDSGLIVPNRFGRPSTATEWQGYEQGGLLVRDPTDREPYVELYMKLRKPLHSRQGLQTSSPAPFRGKGSVHWGENDVIGHVRMHIVRDADGKLALVIDEIQSDWASQWNSLKRYANMAPDDKGTVMQRAKFQLADMKDSLEEARGHLAILEQEPGRYAQEIADTEDQIRGLDGMIEDLGRLLEDVPGPPPLASKQMEAIVRRTLRFAEESGVDRIIITQGDVQAIRNEAYTVTPKGRAIQFHDNPNWVSDKAKWIEDTAGMTQAEIQAFARDPAHADSPMVKAFLDLYGSGDEAGKVQKIFEKEMGVKGGTRKGIFEGGYADESGAITRQAPQDDFVIDGVRYMEDPSYPEPKRGDRVMTVEGPGIVQAAYANGEIGVEVGKRMVVKPGHYVQVIIPDPSAAPVRNATHMMDGYVIEMTDAAKAKARAPMAYYQQRAWEQIPKGATQFFADGTRVIHLFEDADISTVLHELAHVGLADMSEVDRAIIMRNFNGLKTTADHEQYARSFERYIYEGHAMDSGLNGVFAKLKEWMHGVYSHVNQIGATVNPEVKQVFDRMVVKSETPGEQLVRLLKTAPGLLKEQDAITSEERARRIGAAMDIWKQNSDTGTDGFYAALHELRGEIDRVPFAALEELTPEAMDSLLKSIVESGGVRGYEKVRAADAVLRAKEGKLPTRSELALLNKIFGGTLGFKHVRRGRLDRWFTEIWNLPRAVSASWDLSAPLRQTLVAATRHPVVVGKATVPMFKAARPFKKGAEAAADTAEDIAMRENNINGFYGRAKLAIDTHASNDTGVAGRTLANTEEPFASELAEKIPGVKHSARAYETFLHRVRADLFDATLEAARAKNINVESDEFLQGLGRYVNGITGRGTLSRHHLLPLEQASDLLNLMMFSPRLLASRVNMISPVYYKKLWDADPFLFWRQVRATSHTVGVALTVLGTVSLLPGVTVGTDPTSANFGKIRIGNTRVDILAGFNPLMVLIARLAAGYSTSSASGAKQNLSGGFGKSSQYDILQRFGESKMAPTPGILRDILKHQTFINQPLGLDKKSFKLEAINNLTPMMIRDAFSVGSEPTSVQDKVIAALTVITLGGLGVGFNSYPDKAAKSSGGSSGGSKSGSLLDQLPSGSGGSLLDNAPSGGGGSLLDQTPSSSGGGSLLGP